MLLHKIRESLGLARDEGALRGDVEIDGAYFGGYVKPANKVEDRKDLRKAINQSGKRQSVVVSGCSNANSSMKAVFRRINDGVKYQYEHHWGDPAPDAVNRTNWTDMTDAEWRSLSP